MCTIPDGLAERFYKKVNITNTCHLWTAAVDGRGYGMISVRANGGKTQRAHRVAWLLKHGEYPPVGFDLCHSCHVRVCVNVDHLSVDTHKANIQYTHDYKKSTGYVSPYTILRHPKESPLKGK